MMLWKNTRVCATVVGMKPGTRLKGRTSVFFGWKIVVSESRTAVGNEVGERLRKITNN